MKYTFQATIWHCLNHYDYKDATFLAELLYSEGKHDVERYQNKRYFLKQIAAKLFLSLFFYLYIAVHSDESLHLLATCYYRAGKIGQAYDILQTNGPRSSQSKFLLAKCCHDLNK